MNTQFVIWQNRTHPAWLALPLLAALIVGMDLVGASNYEPVHLIQPFILAALGAWIFRNGACNGGPEARRRLKECRMLLWPTLLAILPPTLYSAAKLYEVGGEFREAMLCLHWIGVVALGAMAFGKEFEHKTINALLTSPVSRARVYVEKLVILAVLMLVSVYSAVSSYRMTLDSDLVGWMIAGPLLLFCTGPVLAMKTRSTLATAVFSVSIPAALYLLGTFLLQLAARLRGAELEPDLFVENGLVVYSWVVFPAYGIGMGLWGWRSFKNLQLVEAPMLTDSAHPLAKPIDRLIKELCSGLHGRTSAMVRKELRLHGVAWLVAWIYAGLWLLLFGAQHLRSSETRLKLTLSDAHPLAAGLASGIILLMCGAACVAEERQLGALDWQLTFPATVARQWRIKLLTAAVLSVLLGGLLPLTLGWLGVPGGLQDLLPQQPEQQIILSVFAVVVFSLGVLGSSLSRSAVGGAGAAIALFFGMFALCVTAANGWSRWSMAEQQEANALWNAHQLTPPAMLLSPDLAKGLAWTIFAAGLPAWLVCIFRFAKSNYTSGIPSRGVMARQFAILAGIALLTIGTVAGVATVSDVSTQRSELLKLTPGAIQGRVVPRTTTIDPELARRYGLAQMGGAGMSAAGATNGLTLTNRSSLDPSMVRRYGLVPATNSPAPVVKASP